MGALHAYTVEFAVVGLLPVLTFLAALLYLDSYQLVKLRTVIAVVVCGAVAAAFCYIANAYLLGRLAIDFVTFTRYVGPITEELLKSLIIVVLIRSHRIGFLIDAAILGFAVGTGFATVENLYYLERVRDAGMGTWIVRGFGTALMHGGCTAIFAMMSVALLEQMRKAVFAPFVPGLRWRSCCIRRSTTCTFRRGCDGRRDRRAAAVAATRFPAQRENA